MTKIVVFDIDGTLANVEHRRQFVANRPKNWAAWNAGMPNDTVNEDIKWMLNSFLDADATIILCSGRGEETRAVTEQWLRDSAIYSAALFMRKAKDYRKDSIVKVELLQQIREQWGEPFLWVDDRKQVVDAIRAEGIRVLQVAPGDF